MCACITIAISTANFKIYGILYAATILCRKYGMCIPNLRFLTYFFFFFWCFACLCSFRFMFWCVPTLLVLCLALYKKNVSLYHRRRALAILFSSIITMLHCVQPCMFRSTEKTLGWKNECHQPIKLLTIQQNSKMSWLIWSIKCAMFKQWQH